MADTFATSFGVLNYSGMLFNKGNTRISENVLPHLAKGAVIPANDEFLAVLGDQTHGNCLIRW